MSADDDPCFMLDVPARAIRTFERLGCETIADVCALAESDLRGTKGCGETTLSAIKAALQAHGRGLEERAPAPRRVSWRLAARALPEPDAGEAARRDVHAQLDAFFAARRGGTLPHARVPEEIAPGKVNVLAGAAVPAYKSSATPQPCRAETSLPRKGGQMSAGSTSQSYATVAPSVGPVDSFARKPLPPFWEYQDEQPVKVDVAPVDVAGTAANDGVA